MKTKKLLILCITTILFTFCACGNDSEMTKFKKELESFFTEVESLHTQMNNLDPTSITATVDLLNCLDQMDDQFKYLSNISIPEQYDYLDPLMDEASTYMSTAVSEYHDAYSNNSYNEFTAASAYENYGKACARLNYLIEVIQTTESSTTE